MYLLVFLQLPLTLHLPVNKYLRGMNLACAMLTYFPMVAASFTVRYPYHALVSAANPFDTTHSVSSSDSSSTSDSSSYPPSYIASPDLSGAAGAATGGPTSAVAACGAGGGWLWWVGQGAALGLGLALYCYLAWRSRVVAVHGVRGVAARGGEGKEGETAAPAAVAAAQGQQQLVGDVQCGVGVVGGTGCDIKAAGGGQGVVAGGEERQSKGQKGFGEAGFSVESSTSSSSTGGQLISAGRGQGGVVADVVTGPDAPPATLYPAPVMDMTAAAVIQVPAISVTAAAAAATDAVSVDHGLLAAPIAAAAAVLPAIPPGTTTSSTSSSSSSSSGGTMYRSTAYAPATPPRPPPLLLAKMSCSDSFVTDGSRDGSGTQPGRAAATIHHAESGSQFLVADMMFTRPQMEGEGSEALGESWGGLASQAHLLWMLEPGPQGRKTAELASTEGGSVVPRVESGAGGAAVRGQYVEYSPSLGLEGLGMVGSSGVGCEGGSKGLGGSLTRGVGGTMDDGRAGGGMSLLEACAVATEGSMMVAPEGLVVRDAETRDGVGNVDGKIEAEALRRAAGETANASQLQGGTGGGQELAQAVAAGGGGGGGGVTAADREGGAEVKDISRILQLRPSTSSNGSGSRRYVTSRPPMQLIQAARVSYNITPLVQQLLLLLLLLLLLVQLLLLLLLVHRGLPLVLALMVLVVQPQQQQQQRLLCTPFIFQQQLVMACAAGLLGDHFTGAG